MPMLERTAATLEPCSLHKVLPSVPSSSRSRRQLHTAFWNHGAASVELFDACQALLGGDMDRHASNTATALTPASGRRADVMTASAFLLDFLYPRGTLSLLRKLNSSPLDRYEKPAFRLNNPLSRFQVATVTNTARPEPSSAEKEKSDPTASRDNGKGEDTERGVSKSRRERDHTGGSATREEVPKSFEDIFAEKFNASSLAGLPPKAKAVQDHEAQDTIAVDTARSLEETLPSEETVVKVVEPSDPEKLKKALSLGSSAFPDHVWHLYEHLPPDVKDQYTLDVLRYLAVAPWIPEPRIFCDMVSRLDPNKWSQELVKAYIRAAIGVGDVPSAVSFFSRVLDLRAWPQGFDLLLAHCLTSARWDELLELWDTCRERLLSDDVPKPDLYSTVKIRDFSARISDLWEHIRSISHPNTYPSLKDSFHSLLNYMFTSSMGQLATDGAALIVGHLADPVLYEELIKLCVRRREYMFASDLYKSYRRLPDVRIRIPVLRAMLEVFYPNNAYGMEMVLKDWYGRYENLDYIGYRKFICFYAGQGNVASVNRLWNDYRRLYKSKALADRRAVRALLDVHAVRGDVAKARAVFDEITRQRGRAPDTMQYNVLLSAHDKAWDLDGAIETFAELCEATTPNNYSFGYMMGMTGSRGNLQLTFGLYRMARNIGLLPDVAMINALIEAYCQSDRLSSAESLCNIATRRRVLPEEITYSGRLTSPYTILWNTVLRHYAVRHDLTNVNRILEHMSELKISFDGKTYEYLLLALVLCNQANHALKLVEISEQQGTFTPTAEHYLLLMSGYLSTREPSAVMKISRMMTAKNYPDSAAKMTKLIQAFGLWAQLPRGARLGTPPQVYLEAALLAFRKSLGREDRAEDDDIRSVVEQYSKTIDVLTQMREFATIAEIMALYDSQFPEHSTPKRMPLKLLNSLMRADFYEGKFDRVMEAWDVAFQKAMALTEHPPLASIPAEEQEMHQVPPAHRYLLNESLATVFKVYGATGDVQGLVDLVTKVLDAGFALGGANWNRYVQMLARFGRWQDAFLLCEQVLMPQWQGWARRRQKLRQKARLPLDVRRLGRAYRHARPSTHTLLVLIRQYMELERLAPWSAEPAALVDKVNAECPRFVRAAKTMMPTGSDLEVEMLGKEFAGGGDEDILGYIMKDEDFLHSGDEAELAYPTR